MDARSRALAFVKALPLAHQVGIVTALVALALFGVMFARWLTTPSYTVLYSGLEPGAVADVVDQLETQGVPYRLEAGGATVLVPREQLYATRAAMAGEGIVGKTVPEGYELLGEQGLSVSDFRQRVDYQRALEGELSKTLMAMNGIDSAQVRLVLPQEELFADEQEPVTASVLLDTRRDLAAGEVETVAFLVSSAVEGLAVDAITIADTDGTVLHAPGDAGGASVATNRNLRQTREFEQALAADLTSLLDPMSGGNLASVVVRATLNFDESETTRETYSPEAAVALKEQTTAETYEGAGTLPGGAVGVDGGPLPEAQEGDANRYDRQEATREFGVDKESTRTIVAPGKVEKLSVAIVMNDAAQVGGLVPPGQEIERLATAALGLDPARGDEVAVTMVALPAEPEEAAEPEPTGGLLDVAGRIGGAVVLLLVAVVLFSMTRRRNSGSTEVVVAPQPAPPAAPQPQPHPEELEPVPALAVAGSPLKADVTDLVQRQPEEIAALLRSWLADRRS